MVVMPCTPAFHGVQGLMHLPSFCYGFFAVQCCMLLELNMLTVLLASIIQESDMGFVITVCLYKCRGKDSDYVVNSASNSIGACVKSAANVFPMHFDAAQINGYRQANPHFEKPKTRLCPHASRHSLVFGFSFPRFSKCICEV